MVSCDKASCVIKCWYTIFVYGYVFCIHVLHVVVCMYQDRIRSDNFCSASVMMPKVWVDDWYWAGWCAVCMPESRVGMVKTKSEIWEDKTAYRANGSRKRRLSCGGLKASADFEVCWRQFQSLELATEKNLLSRAVLIGSLWWHKVLDMVLKVILHGCIYNFKLNLLVDA